MKEQKKRKRHGREEEGKEIEKEDNFFIYEANMYFSKFECRTYIYILKPMAFLIDSIKWGNSPIENHFSLG